MPIGCGIPESNLFMPLINNCSKSKWLSIIITSLVKEVRILFILISLLYSKTIIKERVLSIKDSPIPEK